MNFTGYQFFARTIFTHEQDIGISFSHFADLVHQFFHDRGFSYDGGVTAAQVLTHLLFLKLKPFHFLF